MLLLIIASAFWDEKSNISLEKKKKKKESQTPVIDITGDLVSAETWTDRNERAA